MDAVVATGSIPDWDWRCFHERPQANCKLSSLYIIYLSWSDAWLGVPFLFNLLYLVECYHTTAYKGITAFVILTRTFNGYQSISIIIIITNVSVLYHILVNLKKLINLKIECHYHLIKKIIRCIIVHICIPWMFQFHSHKLYLTIQNQKNFRKIKKCNYVYYYTILSSIK